MSGRRGSLGISIVVLSFAALQAHAGTIRDDVSDSEYTNLANQSVFASVGEFQWTAFGSDYLASGTLVDDQWILTAAHVVEDIDASNIETMTFTLGGETYHVSETYFYSGWTGDTNNGGDLGLVKLESTITDIAPATLYELTDENRQIVTVVGYGTTGTGLTGAILPSGTKRAGTNVTSLGSVLDGIPWSGGGDDNLLVADFDQPGEIGDPTVDLGVATDLEYCAAPGDSGGGWFIEDSGQYYLAGVTSFLLSNPASTEYSMYGDIFGATRVSSYLDWIEEYVDFSPPIPSDANHDGVVDDVDASIVSGNWMVATGATWEMGDFNDDGAVNDADASIMATYWQSTGNVVVPEPEVLSLLPMLLLMVLLRRVR